MINFSQSGIGHFRKLVLAAGIITLAFLSSCSSDDSTDVKGNWTEVAQMGGAVRGGAVSFKLGDQVIVGLGYNGAQTSTGRVYLPDFQAYNGISWQRGVIPDFAGTPREGAVSFVLNNKVYVGLGWNRDLDTNEVLSDFWVYDPANPTLGWDSVESKFPVALYNSIAFVVKGRAFVGTGTDGSIWENTIWEFDPNSQSWTSKPNTSIPGKTRQGATVFTLNEQAYIIGGVSNGSYDLNFWKFDPESASQWEKITPSTDVSYFSQFRSAAQRAEASAVVLDGMVYIIAGVYSSALTSCVQYDPNTQIWKDMQSFESTGRRGAVAFELNNRAFFGTGYNGTLYYSDFWEFKPLEDYDADL